MNTGIGRREFLALAAAPLLRGMPTPKIKDVSVIATQPAGVRLVVVKVQTDQDGLYGYGCATFTQRADLIVDAVNQYLKPLVLGRPTDAISDLWSAMYNSSYWRNGPVFNDAISGVDQALWDIKGRLAGMPVYELLGGKCRRGAMIYSHAAGREISETIDQARKIMAQGIKAVRLQVGVPGSAASGAPGQQTPTDVAPSDPVFDPYAYVRRALALFEAGRKELGAEIQLLHDVHERVRRGWQCSLQRTWSNTNCFTWKTHCHRKISTISGRFARTARPPSRWASCSTIRTNGTC